MRPKLKGSTPVPCPAPAPRKLNQNLLQDQVVKTAMAATQHPERVARPIKRMRPALIAKPPGMGKAQTVKALTVKAPAVMLRLQMWLTQRKTMTGKLKDPAVRLKGQTLRVVPAPQKLMVRFQPEQPHQQNGPKEAHQQRRPREATPTSLRCFHCSTWIVRILRRNGKFSSTRMPGFWTGSLVSGTIT